MARSMAFKDLATVVHVWVDDWYQAHAANGRRGQAPLQRQRSDLAPAARGFPALSGGDPVPGLRAGQPSVLFPRLLSQSRFNRRARQLWPRVEVLGAARVSFYLPDAKPLPVVGCKRDKGRSDFAATADYGVCAGRHLMYVGYRPVLLCTPAGVPAAYDLVPASTDARVAGEQVRDWVWQARILGDKGCLGADWRQGCRETRGLELLTPARASQHPVRPADVQRWLHRLRERIEGAFHEVQNTGRHLEHLTCRTLRGLRTHVAAKMASHVLKLLLRRQAGIDIRTFTVAV